eukprot:8189920-Pyramimonas_sp.AAC.1
MQAEAVLLPSPAEVGAAVQVSLTILGDTAVDATVASIAYTAPWEQLQQRLRVNDGIQNTATYLTSLKELIGRLYLPMSRKSAHSFTCNPY